MFQWARSLFNHQPKAVKSAPRSGSIRGRYENAQTTNENARNWWAADFYSAKAANNFMVRRILRMRSRHEISNNPFLFGIANDNADDLIDTGPTLQVLTKNKAQNRQIEQVWADWSAAVDLVGKLRTVKLAKTVDGEGFLVLKNDPGLDAPITLYPMDVEADQVSTPAPQSYAEFWVDGLTLNKNTGLPKSYHVLRNHPGDFYFPDFNPLAVDEIRSQYIVHFFDKFRPGMVRGIPTFTSALDLFTELRSFRKAVLSGAQIAADFAAVLESQAPAEADSDLEYEPFKRVPVDRGMMTQLPWGTKMNQFRPEQPQTTYEMFQEVCLGEACRPLSYPRNLALGTSQKSNFSSAKLDINNYRKGLRVERKRLETTALKVIYRELFNECVAAGVFPRSFDYASTPYEWHWPGFESLDPQVDADATATLLASGQMTRREFWARRGEDWLEQMEQQAEEQKQIEKLGLEYGEPIKRSVTVKEDADAIDDPNAKPTQPAAPKKKQPPQKPEAANVA